MKKAFITLLIFLLPGLSNAQKVHKIEEIVVTATRSPRSAEKVVADVDVVKEEDIWNRPSSQAVKSRLDGMLEQSREISESGGDMVRSAP